MIDNSINDLVLFYGKEKIKLSGDPLLKFITKITDYSKTLRALAKDIDINLLESFYLHSGLNLKNFKIKRR